jgi:hypothetical protein
MPLDGSQTPEEQARDYFERGKRLADLLAAHVAEGRNLVATFTSGSATNGPLDGMAEFVIIVARQVPYPPEEPPVDPQSN